MKYLIILSDGMADEPMAEKGAKTPLQVANKPYIDELTRRGRCGTLATVPTGFAPGSEVANLAVLGYDVARVLEGRGSLEAASMGIPIEEGEMVMRCNLICVNNHKIKNHSAGHIPTEEAAELIEYLNQELPKRVSSSNLSYKLFKGVSYRHLLKVNHGNKALHCFAPHDYPGKEFKPLLIQAENAEAESTATLLNELILQSQELLSAHPINLRRIAEGKDPANSIWPWSPGYKPQMQTLAERFPISQGTVISAVDLIRGIGVYAGLKIRLVEGATGLYDTNYEGKIEAALDALQTDDFVFLHIEASDEAGHEGDFDLKVKTIEYLDQRVIKRLLNYMDQTSEPLTVAMLPDHPTPCAIRTHTSNPVPFVIVKPGLKGDDVLHFDEVEIPQKGFYGALQGDQFICELFAQHTQEKQY